MSYDSANRAFEKAVIKYRENLQYLADSGKLSNKFLSMQNLILKSIIHYQKESELYISDLEMENYSLSLRTIAEYRKLLANKEALEAICFIHGIMDLPCWLAKGRNTLVAEAVEFYKGNMIQLPYKLKNLIEEMNDEDRNTLYEILYRRYNERMDRELQELIEKYRK